MYNNVKYLFNHMDFKKIFFKNAVLYRTLDVTLDLKDPQYPEHNLGSLDLSVTLSPKEGDLRDTVRNLYDHFDLSLPTQLVFLLV